MKKFLVVLGIAALALSPIAAVYAQRLVTQPGYSVLYDDAGRALLVVADSEPSLPVPPNAGAFMYRTDNNTMYQWSGSAWSSAFTISTLTGDVTGDIVGDVTGDVTGSISGGTLAGTTDTFLSGVAEDPDAVVATSANCGDEVHNTLDDDGFALTLPNDPPGGCVIHAINVVAQDFVISPNTNEAIYLGPDECAADTITCNAIGDNVILKVLAAGDNGVWVGVGDAGSTGCTCDDP